MPAIPVSGHRQAWTLSRPISEHPTRYNPNRRFGFFRFAVAHFQATSYAVRNGAAPPLNYTRKSGGCTRWTKGSPTVKLPVVGRITGRLATRNQPRPFLGVSPNRPLVPRERLTIHKRVDKSARRAFRGNGDAVPLFVCDVTNGADTGAVTVAVTISWNRSSLNQLCIERDIGLEQF